MRKVAIRELKAKLSAELKELPFEITLGGKVIAVVVSADEWTVERGYKELANRVLKETKQVPVQTVPDQEDEAVSSPAIPETKQTMAGVLRQYQSLGSVPCSKEWQLRRAKEDRAKYQTGKK